MGIREVELGGRKLVIYEGVDFTNPSTGRALTGSWIWESALHLAEWMTTDGHSNFNLTGKIVLELGAGAGLPGLTAASVLGAVRVVLTDVDSLLPGLRKNTAANELDDVVEVRELMWGSEFEDKVDVVLMSDVFYDAGEMVGLARTLRGLCGEGTKVWAACEVRTSTAECLDVLEREGFSFKVEEISERSCQVGLLREESSLFAVYLFESAGYG